MIRALLVSRRRAFTLIELLIVVSIIGLLVTIMVPALGSAREAARRVQCQNNLHQIGVAMYLYHNDHGTFPRGGWPATTAQSSWGASLLPYMGQQSLYDRLNLKAPYTASSNLAAGQTVVPTFICPSSQRTSLLRQSVDLPSSSPNLYARNDYGGMEGERGLRAAGATNSPERGTMILAKNISLSEITDGLSTSILIGEAPEGMSGMWISVRNLFDQSAPINTRATYGPQYVFYDYGQEINSYHPGGASALFADGAVHFLSATLDNYTLAAFCSRNGGELVDAPK